MIAQRKLCNALYIALAAAISIYVQTLHVQTTPALGIIALVMCQMHWRRSKVRLRGKRLSGDSRRRLNVQRLARLKSSKRQSVIILCGPPGVGKSSLLQETSCLRDYVIISRDNIVTEVAKERGFTYNEMFKKPTEGITDQSPSHPKYGSVVRGWQGVWAYSEVKNAQLQVNELHKQQVEMAVRNKCNVVIDMTNITHKERAKWLKTFESAETRVAVHFAFNNNTEDVQNLIELTKRRVHQPISPKIVEKFAERYEPPTELEGFTHILKFDNRDQQRETLKREKQSAMVITAIATSIAIVTLFVFYTQQQ